jgi:hypothetical protein
MEILGMELEPMERVDYESLIVQEILNAHDREELDINPWYQRRAVWTRPQKGYLINTIHEKKPVPSIYIRHRIDLESEKSLKEVVDGQQRIRCILEYRNGEFAARHPDHAKPVKYDQLTKTERVGFLQTAVSVGYLIGASDSDVIEIFARINSVAKTLNPQEKRNAAFSGAFKQFTLGEAVKRLPFWRENGIFTDNDIARMVEVQFVSDLVMNMIDGLQDFSASKLDRYYETHEEDFSEEQDVRKRLDRIYAQVLALPGGTIKSTVFRRPQVLFSLFLILDSLASAPSTSELRRCIEELDARFNAFQSGQNIKAMTPDVYESFNVGNMHRIKYRRLRRDAIKRYLK